MREAGVGQAMSQVSKDFRGGMVSVHVKAVGLGSLEMAGGGGG